MGAYQNVHPSYQLSDGDELAPTEAFQDAFPAEGSKAANELKSAHVKMRLRGVSVLPVHPERHGGRFPTEFFGREGYFCFRA